MNHWLWIWVAWGKDKCGSIAKALVVTGLDIKHMVLVVLAITVGHTMRRSARPTVESHLKNGKLLSLTNKICSGRSTRVFFSNLVSLMVNLRYHVPRSWLNPTGNLLVVFEEWGGNPANITLVKRRVPSICADVSEWQPSMSNWHTKDYGTPRVRLFCEPGHNITEIKFASFGTPEGLCGSFSEGKCHAHKSYDAFEKVKFPPCKLLYYSC